MADLATGDVIWVEAGPAIGRERRGRRPALVVSGERCLETVTEPVLVVPLTSVSRGWAGHVRVDGARLRAPSWAMTEQLRTIPRERVVGRAGRATDEVLVRVRLWLADFLEL
jgi:mRNA interferase MazF